MSEDMTVFFPADMCEEVSFGSLKTFADFERKGNVQDMGGLKVTVQEDSIGYATSALPGLARDSQITVAGVAYKVREITAEGDGKVSRATLKKV